MPLRTETYDLDDELDRLDEQLEELRQEALEYEETPAGIEAIGERLQAQRDGVAWAIDAHKDDAIGAWGEDVDEVTLGGLTGGEYARVEDALGADRAQRGLDGPLNGATRVHMVAAGTVEAPYHDPSATLTEQVATAADLPVAFQKWVQARVNEMTSVGEGNGKTFAASVAEKRAETSTDS